MTEISGRPSIMFHCCRSRSGCAMSSASMRATIGARAFETTAFELPERPSRCLLSCKRIRPSRRVHSRNSSTEPSVEASSRITNSKSWNVCPRMLLMLSSRNGSALCTGITTLIKGFAIRFIRGLLAAKGVSLAAVAPGWLIWKGRLRWFKQYGKREVLKRHSIQNRER